MLKCLKSAKHCYFCKLNYYEILLETNSLVMKKLQIVSLVFAALLIISCGSLKKMKKDAQNIKYTVTPSPLELHADSVEVSISGNIPPKYFNKKVIVEATPVLKWEGGEKAFAVKKLQGESVEDNNPVINNAEGGSFSYNAKVPYEEGMRISDLEIRVKGYLAGKEDKALEFEPYKVAEGVISTPALVKLDAKGIIGKDKFQRIVPETKYAEILFTIQQSTVRGSETRSEQMKALKEYINEVKANERKEFKGVAISSYASPDGDEQEINAPLSDKRGKSTQTYMNGEFKKVEAAKTENFIAYQATAEDWNGFQELVQASELKDKDLILRVLSMYSDPVQRETEIKNISATYLELAKEILPKLRRSKVNVNVDLIGYSDEEIKAIFDLKADSLNVEEILYAATLYTDADQKLAVYKKAGEIYTDCWRAYNNAAVIYIEKGELDNANAELEKAKTLNASNPIVMNNSAAVQIRLGNFDKAAELLTSAAGAGEEVNYNNGIVNIKKADYAAAVAAFGNNCSFNAGLAKLLNGDNSGAAKAVDCSDDSATALGFYLKAIAGARSADADMLLNNLRAATEKDVSFKAKAKTDMEFAKFFANDTFKSIVE